MALSGKKSGNIHNLSGSDKAKLQAKFDNAEHDIISSEPDDNPILASILYTIQNLSEDIDSLRTYTDSELKGLIATNTDATGVGGNVEFAKKLATARTIGGVSFNGSANIDLPGVNSAGNQNTTGNADSANTLRSARTIGGVSFDGSANINLPGVNTTGNQDTSGTAAEATILETARTIGGVSFDGSANINLPGVNTSGNQDTTGNAATATNAKGYKGSNTTYMLMPKDFYMVNSTSNYAGGYITIPAGGECHAQVSLPIGSSLTKKTLTINSSQVIASVVTVYAVPFDGIGSPTITMVTGGALGKQMTISGSKFDASKYYVWIKISLSDDNSATRVYGGTLTFTNT
jgi:hypothetical protein